MTTETPTPAAVGPVQGLPMDDRPISVNDLEMIQRHICEPSHRGTMAEMKAGFDRIETKIDVLARDDTRRFADIESRQERADIEIARLKSLAGRVLFLYGLVSLAAGGIVAAFGAWLKAKIFG